MQDLKKISVNATTVRVGYPFKSSIVVKNKQIISSCGDQDTLEQAMPINAQINMLEKIAYSTTMSEEDFLSKLKVCIQDPNSCMDPTDFQSILYFIIFCIFNIIEKVL